MPLGARGNILPDTGASPPPNTVVVQSSPQNSAPTARSTETPDVVIYSPPSRTTQPVVVEEPSRKEKPKRPIRSNFVVTEDNSDQYMPKFEVYEPSMGRKVQWWFERNKDKIPFVSFLDELNQNVERAERATLVESAYKDDPIRATVLGFEAGLLEGSILLPVTVAEMGASLVRGVKRGAEEQEVISGWLGLQHGNPLKGREETIVGKSYEEELSDELLLTRYAPGVYEAEKKLEQAQALESEAKTLLAEGEKLQEQYKWFEEMAPKAQENPFLADLYNIEAKNFNRQVMDYNRRVETLQRKYESLNVEGALKTIDDFNKNIDKVSKYMLVGEIAGSAAGTSVMANMARTVDFFFGPERATTRRVVIKEPGGTRVVEKTTIYKGIAAKRPIRTTQISLVVEGSGDDLLGATPISFSDDVARAVKFKAKFGKPTYERGIKVTEDDAFIHFGLDDVREFRLDKWLRKEGFESSAKPVSEPVLYNGRLFTPEEWSALQRITKKVVVTSGKKWSKVSVSGNVAQGVYDPPTQRLLATMDEGVASAKAIKVDMGNYMLNVVEAEPKVVVAPPAATNVAEFEVVVPEVDIKTVQGVTSAQIRKMARIVGVKHRPSQRTSYREEEELLPWEKDLETYLERHRLEYRRRFNVTTSQEVQETPKPLDVQLPDTIVGPALVEVGGERLNVNVGEVELQRLAPATFVTPTTLLKDMPVPSPPKLKPPKPPIPFAKPRRKRDPLATMDEALEHMAWHKRYGNDLFKSKGGSLERSLKVMERALAKLEAKLGGKKKKRRRKR